MVPAQRGMQASRFVLICRHAESPGVESISQPPSRRSCPLDFSAHRLHLSHCLLTVLATLEDAEPFEELRQAYNSVRTEDLAEVPEQKAWTMVGFCNHIFCRWVPFVGSARISPNRHTT